MSHFSHGGDVHKLARRLGLAPEQVIDFSASINPLGPPPAVLEGLSQGLDFLLRNYPEPLADSLAQALGRRLGLEPEWILPGNGSTELIHLLPRALPGRRALILAPAFGEYEAALGRAGWTVEHFPCPPEGGFQPDPETLLRRLEDSFDLVFLAQPGNPSGAVADRDLVLELAGRQAQQGGWLVADEAFIDFAPGCSLVPDLPGQPGLVVLRSLTKFYGLPGLRLGFLAARPELVERLRALKEPWSVNALAQRAGLICLEEEEFAARTRALIERERPRLAAELEELGCRVWPSAANYLLFRLDPGHPPAGRVVEGLARRGLLVRDCANFIGLGPGWLRVSVRLAGENDRLLEELARVLAPA